MSGTDLIDPSKRIAIGADHAGYRYKEAIKRHLTAQGWWVMDAGTHSAESTDYPIWIRPVAEAIAKGEVERGIVLGGSGNGEAMVANRVKGVRCALAWNVESARLGREHNDANCLSIGERMMTEREALAVVDVFLSTPFAGGRHVKRVEMIDA